MYIYRTWRNSLSPGRAVERERAVVFVEENFARAKPKPKPRGSRHARRHTLQRRAGC